MNKLKQTLQRQVSLRGQNLVLNRYLDQAFDRFESSQTFNLVDVGEHPQGAHGARGQAAQTGGSLFPGGEYEVVYAGSVVPPK